MRIPTFGPVLALLIVFQMNVAAAPVVIGTIAARGAFRIDDATVNSNATLFEGATVETRLVASALDLSNGARVSLAPASRGRIFGDRLILEKGSAQTDSAQKNYPAAFRLEALGLAIRPDTGTASIRVTVAGSKRVQVASVAGSAHVLNSSGIVVANLSAGAALEFEPQAGGEPWKMTGCLRAITGHFVLTDETTSVTVELAGGGLDREGGNRVEITGALDPTATPVNGATQVIRVSQVRRVGRGCPGEPGAAAAGKGGGGGAAGGAGRGTAGGGTAGGVGGLATTTTIAIIGGVAAAATLGGLAAAEQLPGQGSPGTPVSR